MTTVILDDSLEFIELDFSKDDSENKEKAIAKLIGNNDLQVSSNNLHPLAGVGSFSTQGMMEYLNLAYNNHKGVVISPEIMWLLILNEIAQIVSERPEVFQEYFTYSTDNQKVEISVLSDDDTMLPVDKIVEKLKELCPIDVDVFFPEMNALVDNYQIASHSAFADAVSPYYNYSMFMCGIPKIHFVGSDDDWKNIQSSLFSIGAKIKDSIMEAYLGEVYSQIQKFIDRDVEVLSDMFGVERCGSGGQVEVIGWFQNFYYKTPDIKYTYNYSTSISTVEYKNLSTNKDFVMFTGVMSSSIGPEDFLVPYIDVLVAEKTNG